MGGVGKLDTVAFIGFGVAVGNVFADSGHGCDAGRSCLKQRRKKTTPLPHAVFLIKIYLLLLPSGTATAVLLE